MTERVAYLPDHQPRPEFHGLSVAQLRQWVSAPLSELPLVTLQTPDSLSSSPVICYLELILEEARTHSWAFKATSRGNLPAKLVKRASDLLPTFAVAEFERNISISEFAGSNEDKFNALRYTRVLAQLTGVIALRRGQFRVSQAMQKQYDQGGVGVFFMPLVEAAVRQYNWGYFDAFEDDIDLRNIWLFMLWRLQQHQSLDRLTDEVMTAFPRMMLELTGSSSGLGTERLNALIESRFIRRFLEFWGFVTLDPKRFSNGERIQRSVNIQPLLSQTFQFAVGD